VVEKVVRWWLKGGVVVYLLLILPLLFLLILTQELPTRLVGVPPQPFPLFLLKVSNTLPDVAQVLTDGHLGVVAQVIFLKQILKAVHHISVSSA